VSHIDVKLDDLKLSVSKTKTFKDCKRKYKFRYINKLPQLERDYLTYGSMFHRVLELFHLHYINNPLSSDKWNEVMKISFKESLKEFSGKITKEMKNEAYEAICVYLKHLKTNGFPNILSCEEKFNVTFENNVTLIGFIDRVQIDSDDILHVCDYKTSKSDKYLKGDYFQLLVYAFIMLKKNPTLQKVRGSYMMIKDDFKLVGTDVNKPFLFERDKILEVENMFLNYAVDIRSEKEFLPNPTILCNWCDYVDSCPEGKNKVFIKPIYGEVSW
jgi:ATP-dependent helicase/DNAse subunit B